ncbi:PaaI family thioesterase [Amycolatopsis magusensis]|uniref:PaaI family thioesterase n=1 Tax=Amycolatopsis magusensis TaxID=882444 RepID=UPI003C2BB3D9
MLAVAEPHTVTGALHGGAIAAMAAASAQATMRASDPDLDPYTLSIHVIYARAGLGTAFTAATTTVRRARELGYYQTEICDQTGAVIAGASTTLADGRHRGTPAPSLPPPAGDPAEFERETQAIPFLTRRGLRVGGVDEGIIEITMTPEERNLGGKGAFDEGAVLTLIDLAGSSVPWTLSPRPSNRGATIALHAQIFGEPPAAPIIARARVRAHDDRVFSGDVTVRGRDEGRLCALGQVTYRFS